MRGFSFDFHLRNVCCLEQILWKQDCSQAEVAVFLEWSFLFEFQFGSVVNTRLLPWNVAGVCLGAGGTLCIVCSACSPTRPSQMLFRSPHINQFSFLLNFLFLQQGLISHDALVWWLEPGYSPGLKLGKVSRGRSRVVSGGTQPRTNERHKEAARTCSRQTMIEFPEAWSTGCPWTSEKVGMFYSFCVWCFLCTRAEGEEEGVGFCALWAASEGVQTFVYIDAGKVLPWAERNLSVLWV